MTHLNEKTVAVVELNEDGLCPEEALLKEAVKLQKSEFNDFTPEEQKVLPLLELAVKRSAKGATFSKNQIAVPANDSISDLITPEEMKEYNTNLKELSLLTMKKTWCEMIINKLGFAEVKFLDSTPEVYRNSLVGSFLTKGFENQNKVFVEKQIRTIDDALNVA